MNRSRKRFCEVHSSRRHAAVAAMGVAVIMSCALMLLSCDKEDEAYLERLKLLERTVYRDQDLSEKTIDELRTAIDVLRDEVDRTVKAGEYLGTYYRMVGIRFLDREMYGLAAEFFGKAVDVEPGNPFLSYKAGVCTAQLSRAQADELRREELLKEAERRYLYAVEIDPGYVDARYALAVLYVFEFERPEAAEPHLAAIMAKEERNFRAMFLLARIYAGSGRISEAVGLYDRIAEYSNSEEMVEQAERNKRDLLGGGNGM